MPTDRLQLPVLTSIDFGFLIDALTTVIEIKETERADARFTDDVRGTADLLARRLSDIRSTLANGVKVVQDAEFAAEVEAKVLQVLNGDSSNLVKAIKEHRSLTREGLKESRDYVLALMERHGIKYVSPVYRG